jgi:hypothetical protein
MFLPQRSFIASRMVLLMMDGTERDGKFSADLVPSIVRSGCDGRGSAIARNCGAIPAENRPNPVTSYELIS